MILDGRKLLTMRTSAASIVVLSVGIRHYYIVLMVRDDRQKKLLRKKIDNLGSSTIPLYMRGRGWL